jgi:hypothetical protein
MHHDGQIAGHLGMEGTPEIIMWKFWWNQMADFVKCYVQGVTHVPETNIRIKDWLDYCNLCQYLKDQCSGPNLLSSHNCHLHTEGYDAIYVIADHLTKMAHFILCKSTCTLEQLVELHIHHVWPLHGLPLHHNTNWGPLFTALYMRELYQNLSIDQQLSTAYHLETQGQVESNHKWLEIYLPTYCQDDWAAFIHTAKFTYNNHFHPSIGTLPFYGNYGYHLVCTDQASPDQVLELPKCLHQIHETQARCQMCGICKRQGK